MNGTIISILLATVTLYFGRLLATKEELLRQLFEEAEGLRAISPARTWYHLVDGFPPEWRRRPEEWRDRLDRLMGLVMGVPMDGVASGDDAGRGAHMLYNMNWLVLNYPVRPPKGSEADSFVTEDALRRWLDDVEIVLADVEPLYDESLREKAERFAVAEARAKAKMFAPPPKPEPPPGFERPAIPETPSLTLTEFYKVTDDVSRVVRVTRTALRHYNWYISRIVPRWQMVTIVGLSVLMLFFGAVFPMLIDPLPRLVYLWLPSVFYLFMAVLGIWRLGGRQLGFRGRDEC